MKVKVLYAQMLHVMQGQIHCVMKCVKAIHNKELIKCKKKL